MDNFEFHDIDNQVKPNAPGFKQSKSCRSSQDVHIIQTSIDSTLQSAGITHVNKSTTPTKGSNSLLSLHMFGQYKCHNRDSCFVKQK